MSAPAPASCSARGSGLVGPDRVRAVALADGREVAADLVLIGIGNPAERRSRDGGRPAGRERIAVDAMLATEDPAVSAIGDCASVPSPHAGGARVRIESVQNAVDGARCVAARLTGRPAAFTAVPWFWSDQGPLKLQIAGLCQPHDHAVRRGDPDPAASRCSATGANASPGSNRSTDRPTT